jgi:hypothetical protein
MSDQTTINRLNGNRTSGNQQEAPRSSGFARLASDITELVELQIRLLTEDLKQTVRRIVVPLIVTVVGGALLLGCIPVLLIAVGDLIVVYGEWPEWGALLASGGIVFLLSAGMLWFAFIRLRRCIAPLERSVQELGKNFAALRGMLVDSKRQR